MVIIMTQPADAVATDGLSRPSALIDDTRVAILVALSCSHMLNDVMQSLVPSVYPILQRKYGLDYGQIGLITMAAQLTASLLQPFVGLVTDRHPKPYALPLGMGCTFIGLLCLSIAPDFWTIVGSVALIGVGSSIFHPEAVACRPTRVGADGTASRNRCFRWAAMPARRSDRCAPRSSLRRAARAASPGSRSSL